MINLKPYSTWALYVMIVVVLIMLVMTLVRAMNILKVLKTFELQKTTEQLSSFQSKAAESGKVMNKAVSGAKTALTAAVILKAFQSQYKKQEDTGFKGAANAAKGLMKERSSEKKLITKIKKSL
ncbi:MAG: hypothetical protein IJ225_03785 [Solobacterium sp.]|nr:hypothetical protein [Solobacterium sp.]